MRKKKRARDIMLSDSRPYSHQSSMILALNQTRRSVGQIESPETKLHTYGQLNYDRGRKNTQWRKDTPFNKWCWENETATCKRMKSEHSLMSYIKINSKWIKDLNIRPRIIKLTKENIGRTL